MYSRFSEENHALIRALQPILGQFIADSPEHGLAMEKLRRFQQEQDRQAC